MDVRRIARIALASLLVLSLAAMAGGCQRASESVIEESTGVGVDADDEAVIINGPEGEQVEGRVGSAPEGWPSDLPLYDPDAIESSTSVTTDEGATMSVMMTTTDSFDDVLAWHKKAAADNGWSVDDEGVLDMGEARSGFMLTTKGDTQGNISVTLAEDGTVNITVVVIEP